MELRERERLYTSDFRLLFGNKFKAGPYLTTCPGEEEKYTITVNGNTTSKYEYIHNIIHANGIGDDGCVQLFHIQ